MDNPSSNLPRGNEKKRVVETRTVQPSSMVTTRWTGQAPPCIRKSATLPSWSAGQKSTASLGFVLFGQLAPVVDRFEQGRFPRYGTPWHAVNHGTASGFRDGGTAPVDSLRTKLRAISLGPSRSDAARGRLCVWDPAMEEC